MTIFANGSFAAGVVHPRFFHSRGGSDKALVSRSCTTDFRQRWTFSGPYNAFRIMDEFCAMNERNNIMLWSCLLMFFFLIRYFFF